jgi:hypothetical protein
MALKTITFKFANIQYFHFTAVEVIEERKIVFFLSYQNYHRDVLAYS